MRRPAMPAVLLLALLGLLSSAHARTLTASVETASPTAQPTTTLALPVNPEGNSELKVVCYLDASAWDREGLGQYHPTDIDASLCTHIVYGAGYLSDWTLTMAIRNSDIYDSQPEMKVFEKLVAYRKKGVKVLVSIGGCLDPTHGKYSRLVTNPAARARFVNTTLEFIERFGFDGFDISWRQPECGLGFACYSGNAPLFGALVAELRAAFRPKGYLLSHTVQGDKELIDVGYDVPALSRDLDWIAVPAFSVADPRKRRTGLVAPLYRAPGDASDGLNDVNTTMHYWMAKGADKKKLVMGMPMFGLSFTLADNSQHGLNAESTGLGAEGEFTDSEGILAHYEICDSVKKHNWTVVRRPEGRTGTYAYGGNQWVAYDDVEDVRRKSRFIKELGLAGSLVVSLVDDDFMNRCGCGQYPLLKTINQELRGLNSTINCT